MLLHPQNASFYAYRRLKFKVDSSDWEARETWYFCPDECSFSLYEGIECLCGRKITKKVVYGVQELSGAFVNEKIILLVGDDMRLMPLSTTSVAALLQDKGLTDQCNVLEKQVVHVEVMQLLVNTLFSGTPLTDLVFPKKLHPISALTTNVKFLRKPKEEPGTAAEDKERKIQVKLISKKSDKKILYAEAGSDFIDLVFSFLTIPAGAVVKLLDGNSPMKSLNNLFGSIKDSSIGNLLKVKKELLVNPTLAPSFKCDHQLLNLIQEKSPEYYSAMQKKSVKTRNPKRPVGNNSDGGNFMNMKELEIFMVTDDLIITPLASTDIVSLLDGFKVPIGHVEEILVTVGKCEALNLLKASLGSTTVLTDVFSYFPQDPQEGTLMQSISL